MGVFGERGAAVFGKIRAMRPNLFRFAVASLTLLACNTPAPEGAKKDLPVEVTKTPPPAVDTPPPADIKAAVPAPDTKTAGDPTQPSPEPEAKAEPVPEPVAEPAADPAAAAAAAAAATKKLLDEVKAKKTSDARAKKALDEAEKGGASVRELAEAANKRGEALFADPERAAEFFTWAKDKDPSYPDPVFNLAKQSANAGEVPETVALLKEVSKRGGKTLLKQVGFDPVFEIVKDDAEVQKLIK